MSRDIHKYSAGVIPVTFFGDPIEGRLIPAMLLQVEVRQEDQRHILALGPFAGKKEPQDRHSPVITATREFIEETCNLFEWDDVLERVQYAADHGHYIYHSYAKMYLFFITISYDETLPDRYLECNPQGHGEILWYSVDRYFLAPHRIRYFREGQVIKPLGYMQEIMGSDAFANELWSIVSQFEDTFRY